MRTTDYAISSRGVFSAPNGHIQFIVRSPQSSAPQRRGTADPEPPPLQRGDLSAGRIFSNLIPFREAAPFPTPTYIPYMATGKRRADGAVSPLHGVDMATLAYLGPDADRHMESMHFL